MRRTLPVLDRERFVGSFCSLIGLVAFVDDVTFLTKNGALGIVLRIGDVDDECLDPAERDAITRRFETALRLLDDRTHLYQYLLKENRVELPPVRADLDPAVATILGHRHAWLGERRETIFRYGVYWVLLEERRDTVAAWRDVAERLARHPIEHLHTWMSTRMTVLHLDGQLSDRVRRLRQRVEAFALQLQDPLTPQILGKHDAFAFWRRLLNYDRTVADAVGLREDTFLDFHVADSPLECHRAHLRLGDHYVRVLTLKEPPAQTVAHVFRDVTAVAANAILVSHWRREAPGAIRRQIHAKRRHFHNTKVSLAAYLTDASADRTEPLVDESAAAVVRDLGAALTELTLHGRYFGTCTVTAVVYDRDPAVLDRAVAAARKAFAAHDAQVTEERYNLLHAWLAVLPGHDAYNIRGMYLLNSNYADCSFLFQPRRGSPANAHLGREALIALETSRQTLYELNLHVDDVGHTLVLGATGSGKSFWLNLLVTHLQRYRPKTLIFDLGGGYDAVTEWFGGRTIRIARDDLGFTINPFSLASTAANRQFLFAFVKVLIQIDGQHTVTRAEDQALFEQIGTLYQLDPDQRRLFTLASILPRSLAVHLQRWVQGGQYGDLFDHVDDTVTMADFQCLDFEGLDAAPQILEPLLFYLLHRAAATVIDPDLGETLKVFVLDEAWRFLRDPSVRAYVTEALKTWRKKNASVILATQSSDDLESSSLLQTAAETCPTKCFLANPNLPRATYRERFHLSETEVERIAGLIPRRQLLIKQPEHAIVLTVNVDPQGVALFSGRHVRVTAAPKEDA